VATLISGAADLLDGIDLYCANAGIARPGGEDATEPDWEASWQVNVMAHVRAARLLTGPWLEQGKRSPDLHGIGGRPADHARLGPRTR